MMKKIIRNSMLILAAACMAQCTDGMDEIIQENPELQADKVELSANISPIKDAEGNENSRLSTGLNGKNSWTEDDQLLVFVRPIAFYDERQPWEESVYRFNKASGDNSKFYLDGTYKLDNGSLRNKLELDPAKKYSWYAIYPFMKMEELGTPDAASLNIPTIQVQDCNNPMAHVSERSIMVADATNTVHPVLQMKHAMTLVKFTVVNDENKPVKLQSLTFQCDDGDLSSANDAVKDFNLHFNGPWIDSHDYTRDYATVSLKNAKTLQAGEQCDVYMILPPVSIYGDNMSVSIISDAGFFMEKKNMDHIKPENPFKLKAGCLNTATVHLKGSVPNEVCTGFDPDFLSYLVDPKRGNLDANGDGQLSKSEVGIVTELSIRDRNLTSIKGIENFTELMGLEVYEILESEYEEDYVYPGSLKEVDLSKNTKLRYIDFSRQPITELNLANNKELEDIFVGGTKLKSLDLQNQTKLMGLGISYTDFTSLPIMGTEQLELIDCTKCKFTELDLSMYNDLGEVYCDSNQISKLVLPKKISYVYCADNKLTELDVSETELSSLDVRGNPGIRLTISEKQNIYESVRYDSDAIVTVKPSPIINFADKEFKKALLSSMSEYDRNNDGELSEFEVEYLSTIVLNKLGNMPPVSDLSKFPILDSFGCADMYAATDIDLTGLPQIRNFEAGNCQALKTFKVGPRTGNYSFTLSLRGDDINTAMTELDLSNVVLDYVNVRGFKNLKTIYVATGTEEWAYRGVQNWQDIVKFK